MTAQNTPVTPAASASDAPHAESASVIIFGASGDLTARKLLPALFDLWSDGYLADNAPIIGVARREKSDESFRAEMYEAINGHVRAGAVSHEHWSQFASRLFYRQLDIASGDGYPDFKKQVEAIEDQQGVSHRRVVYMATSPDFVAVSSATDASGGSQSMSTLNRPGPTPL